MPVCSKSLKQQHVANSLRTIFRIIAICTLAIIALLIPSFHTMAIHAQAEVVEHSAIVHLKEGSGYIERNHKILKLTKNVAVLARARDIVVAQTGTITITYIDGQVTVLPPRSEMEIVFHANIDGEQRIVLLQHAGRSINNADKRTDDDSRFEVQTASSIAAVNKTQFAVELSDNQQVRYSSNLGTVKVFVGDQKPIEVNEGYEAAVEDDTTIEVAPMHNTRRTALFTKKTASVCSDERVKLQKPSQEEMSEDIIDFYGTAIHDEFDYYKLEYTVVGRPANKYSWLYRGDDPVEDGLLASIDVSDLAAGDYVIRLMVVDKIGNYPETCSVNLTIE